MLGSTVPLLEGSAERGPVTALVRPEAVKLLPDGDATARVLTVSFLGSLCRVQVTTEDGTLVVAQASAQEASGLGPGTAVAVRFLQLPVFATAA